MNVNGRSPSCGRGALERCARLIGESCAMHPNKIVDKNHDDLRANVDAAGEHLTALWSELRIPLTGEKWNEAEAVVIALRNIIDDTRGALPPKHDPIRAAKAEAWQEGLMEGFGQGQHDAQGIDYIDTPNPYKD